MELSLVYPHYYRVKRGQTLCGIAKTFSLPPCRLASENGLTEEVREGQILILPPCAGNLYTVRGGESKTLLCGSREEFFRLNGTHAFYPGQTVSLK